MQNKARTAIVTIDWYKKRFSIPITHNNFEECLYIDESNTIPQIGSKVYINVSHGDVRVDVKGVVESVIHIKNNTGDITCILLNNKKT